MLEHMVQLSSYNYVLSKSSVHKTTSINLTNNNLLIMSSPEKSETMANHHPAAVKAGGMRIVQDKSHLKKKSDTPVPKPEEEALKVSTSPPKQIDLMSGAKTKEMDGFPPAAVQAFHDKPAPTRDMNNSHKPTVHLQQPRK